MYNIVEEASDSFGRENCVRDSLLVRQSRASRPNKRTREGLSSLWNLGSLLRIPLKTLRKCLTLTVEWREAITVRTSIVLSFESDSSFLDKNHLYILTVYAE